MALALALVSAGPPLVVHNGWPGLVLAVVGVAYAAYLLLGKRWPRLRRRTVARPPRPKPGETSTPAGAAVRTDASERGTTRNPVEVTEPVEFPQPPGRPPSATPRLQKPAVEPEA